MFFSLDPIIRYYLKLIQSLLLHAITTTLSSQYRMGIGWTTIYSAQILLIRKTDAVNGLRNPLLLNSWKTSLPFVQILNPNGSHWVVASTIGCSAGCVQGDRRSKKQNSVYAAADQ